MEPNSNSVQILDPESSALTDGDPTEFLRSIFITRQDTYAIQKSNGGGYERKNSPLTKEILLSHLEGQITIGVYPAKNNITRWLVFDVDTTDTGDILKIRQRLDHFGVPTYLEFSGCNYHVWVFFDQPLANYLARKFAEFVVNGAGCKVPAEIFPKQDQIKDFGSCIKLPFGIHRKTGRRCDFVDEELQPITDRAGFLRSIKKADEKTLKEILESHGVSWSTQDSVQLQPTFKEPCIQQYWEGGAPEGQRTLTTYQLAIRLKELGLPEGKALEYLKMWRGRCEPGSHEFTEVELKTQVQNVYTGNSLQKAGCGHRILRSKCVGRGNCPFFKTISKKVIQGHNNEMYLHLGWQRVLTPGEVEMVGYVLPLIEKEKNIQIGEDLFTTKKELSSWSGLSNPGSALIALKKWGLIEYTPGKRGGGDERKPTVIRRITPIPKSPWGQGKNLTLKKKEVRCMRK